VHNFLEAGKTPLAGQVDAAHDGLLAQNVQPLIKLLESLFEPMTARSAKDTNEAVVRHILETFWFTRKRPFLSELCLIMNPSAKVGEGHYGFVDIFIPGSLYSSCVELKNATLEGLWKGENRGELNSDGPLRQLREKLRKETEDQLLARKVKYRRDGRSYETSVQDMKDAAFRQINSYLAVMKKGRVGFGHAGVSDIRIRRHNGKHPLVGYVVICLGGTRVLAWQANVEEAACSFVSVAFVPA
jgi:hypothetical protein